MAENEVLVALNTTVHGQWIAVSDDETRRNPLHDVRVRVHRYEAGRGWHHLALTGVTIRPSSVDLLPDGEILLVQTRSVVQPFQPVRDNAQVFDPAGRAVRSFRVGDGVRHLAVDEPGTVWAGYFDEGVFGGDPLSAAGVNRFDEYGRRLWSYRPPPGLPDIADCYALNVGARETWACYYIDFPLVRITDTDVLARAAGPVRGPRAMVVHEDEVVFLGGYGDPYGVTSWHLGTGTSEPVALLGATGVPVRKFRVVSTRGSRLFLRTAGRLLEADLAEPPS